MTVTATKLTDIALARKACAFTSGKETSNIGLATLYKCEHSPIRCILFWIEMKDIPSFVSVHFVRHKIGVEHFVKSLRDDRGGDGTEDRNSPVNHAMLINAQELIHMARKRMCNKAHPKTREVMNMIWKAIYGIDPYLADYMGEDCQYRRQCVEPHSCGYWDTIKGNK